MAKEHMIITGGAGFIGVNAARRYLGDHDVTILDNLSREGVSRNLEWLRKHGSFEFHKVDIRDREKVDRIFATVRPDKVLHMAAQVAVTLSVEDPREDFESNCIGTFNIIEAVRKHCPEAVLLFASTNKVYGEMEGVAIKDMGKRYMYHALPYGVSEEMPLCFHSPYGCSKGAADQYVMDYGRIYGLRTVVLRQSCIYGYRQFGVEDQGWIAWFIISAVFGRQISIYGDGKQIRDALFIDDLVDCFHLAFEYARDERSDVFNIGGGPKNTLSILELVGLLRNDHGLRFEICFKNWRPGDQKVYVSDIHKAKKVLGWEPKTDVQRGVAKLVQWVKENQDIFVVS